MTKTKKARIIAVFAATVMIVAGLAVFLNIRETQEGIKSFQIEIISDRDNYHNTTKEKSDLLYLGEYLRIMDGCQYEESGYGLFVIGWHGMEQDISNEYWWSISVNGESAMVGADEIPILGGDIYTFTLLQGWDY